MEPEYKGSNCAHIYLEDSGETRVAKKDQIITGDNNRNLVEQIIINLGISL